MDGSYVIAVAHQVEEVLIAVWVWAVNTQLGTETENIVNLKVSGSVMHGGKEMWVALDGLNRGGWLGCGKLSVCASC